MCSLNVFGNETKKHLILKYAFALSFFSAWLLAILIRDGTTTIIIVLLGIIFGIAKETVKEREIIGQLVLDDENIVFKPLRSEPNTFQMHDIKNIVLHYSGYKGQYPSPFSGSILVSMGFNKISFTMKDIKHKYIVQIYETDIYPIKQTFSLWKEKGIHLKVKSHFIITPFK